MIVLIGTKESNIQSGKLKTVCCPRCNKESLYYTISSKYVHLTLIPLFAVGKLFESKCNNCNTPFAFEDFNYEEQQKILEQDEIRKAKSPCWNYLGLIILIGISFYWGNLLIETNENAKNLVDNPMIGDVYQLKSKKGYYPILKIDSVSNDSVYLLENNYYSNLPYDFDDVDKPENYSKNKVDFSKKDIKSMLDKDDIVTVKRK
jgi:hypothetical protein